MIGLKVAVLAGALLASNAAVAGELKFAIPDGWVEMGPTTPADRLEGAPQALVDAARSGKYAAMAIDLARPDVDEFSHMNAIVRDGEVSFKNGASELAKDLIPQLQKQNSSVRLRSQDTIEIGGVYCARIAYDIELSGSSLTVVQYYMPAGKQFAVLSYTTHRGVFDTLQARLEAAAKRTVGLAEAGVQSPPEDELERSKAYLAGALAGRLLAALGVVGLLAFLLRKALKKAFGPSIVAGLVAALLLALGGQKNDLAIWNMFTCLLASAVWWLVFRRA